MYFRTPSANKEPTYRLRYDNPIGASPSRNLDHPRPFDEDDFDRSLSCRSSMGRSIGTIPNYNGKHYNIFVNQLFRIYFCYKEG